MNTSKFSISAELPTDHQEIEDITSKAFGPGRFARTAFRLREGKPHIPALSFVVRSDGNLVGSVRLTEIHVGNTPIILLGPLVVSPSYNGEGVGSAMMEKAVLESKNAGYAAVLLVGDLPYYSRFGFEQVPHGSITLPGPVDPRRLLICNLNQTETPISGMAR